MLIITFTGISYSSGFMRPLDVKVFMKTGCLLLRDITGECEGECRDRVREGEFERQHEINLAPFEEIKSYPNVTWAHTRNETPDVWEGLV